MKLIRGNRYLPKLGHDTIATIGNFDGLHLGHQHLIKHVIKQAKQEQLASLIISFEPTPKEYFMRDKAPARIYTFREKLEYLRAFHPDYFVVLNFNQELANMAAEDFVSQLLVQSLGIKKLFVGDDFKFGCQRRGDIHLLSSMGEKLGFEVTDAKSVMQNTQRVSSTLIREKLIAGEFAQAAELLTRPFTISGKIFHGDRKGRTIGFPTANIFLKRQALPLRGVFAVSAQTANKQWNGVANIGHRPTVNGTRDQCEVHLFDCDEDLYGQRLSVCFHKKIREEQKFSGLDALMQQITADVAETKHYFSKG